MIDSMMTFFKSGGTFMFPIAAIGLLAFAIVIERFIVINLHYHQIGQETRRFMSLFNSEKKTTAVHQLQTGRSLLAQTLSDAATSYEQSSVSKTMFEEMVDIHAIDSLRRLTRRTTIISTLANVATLLGLLGTIMGLIQSFASVAQAPGADKSTLLSASVSVAMNTTAFGLMIAIPLLLMYVLIDNTSNKTVEKLQTSCLMITNKLYQENATA